MLSLFRSGSWSGEFWSTPAVVVPITFLMLVALVALLPGCRSKDDDVWPKDKAGPKVVVSFAPLYCFAVNVAGDDAVVRSMMTTAGPHNFNPTDQEAKLLHRADLFFINGLGLDNEQAETLEARQREQPPQGDRSGEPHPAENMLLAGGDHDDDDGDADHHHHEGGHDPHVWLSPDYAVILVEGIRDELKASRPGSRGQLRSSCCRVHRRSCGSSRTTGSPCSRTRRIASSSPSTNR